MSLLDFLFGNGGDSSGGLVNWNTPRPAAAGPQNFGTLAQAYGYQQPAQQSGMQKIAGALSRLGTSFAGNENSNLAHLSALASASPQFYANAYGSALAGQSDPKSKAIDQQYKLAQIDKWNNPINDPLDILRMQKAQQELDQQQKTQQLLSGGALSNYGQPAPNQNMPMNMRNNNPGNLKDPSSGEFRTFNDPQEGALANLADLQLKISGDSPAMKAKFGDNYEPNLSNLISTWAPASDNNNPAAYADFVSKKTGIPIDRKLSVEDAARILPAIAEFEGGQPYNALATVPQPPMAPPQSALASYAPLPQTQTNAMTLPDQPQESALVAQARQLAIAGAITPNEFLNIQQKEAEKAAKVASEDIPGDPTKRGPEYLATIPDGDIKNKAQAIIEGRAPFPNITSRTPSNVKAALAVAQQADPTLSAATFPMRAKAAKDFASGGQEAKSVNALNTALNHLNTLSEAADELHNTGSTWVNWAVNPATSVVSDKFNARLKKYEAAKNAVASEVAKVYKGVGALSVEEQREWQKILSPNLGPEAQKAAIAQTAELLRGKIDALSKQYNDAFGGTQEKDFLSPKAKKVFVKLGVPMEGADTSGPAQSRTINGINYHQINGQWYQE